jgi:hypothetical protein
MKTWKEFVELKEAMGTTPPLSPRRSATLNLSPEQKAQGLAAHQAATQGTTPTVAQPSMRRSATLNLSPEQRAQGQATFQAARNV